MGERNGKGKEKRSMGIKKLGVKIVRIWSKWKEREGCVCVCVEVGWGLRKEARGS